MPNCIRTFPSKAQATSSLMRLSGKVIVVSALRWAGDYSNSKSLSIRFFRYSILGRLQSPRRWERNPGGSESHNLRSPKDLAGARNAPAAFAARDVPWLKLYRTRGEIFVRQWWRCLLCSDAQALPLSLPDSVAAFGNWQGCRWGAKPSFRGSAATSAFTSRQSLTERPAWGREAEVVKEGKNVGSGPNCSI